MTPEKAKALLPLITAFAEGKTIQIQAMYGEWVDMRADVGFIHDVSYYRIKPEPIVVRRKIKLCRTNYEFTVEPYRFGTMNVEFIFDDATNKLIDVKFIGKQGESK